MEGVRGARAVGGRIGQRLDDLELLDRRAGPAVGDDQRQRVLVLRANVDEVDVDAIDLGDEMRQGREARLERAPVVVVRPVAAPVPGSSRAARPARDRSRGRATRRCDAAPQVGELLVGDLERERADRLGPAAAADPVRGSVIDIGQLLRRDARARPRRHVRSNMSDGSPERPLRSRPSTSLVCPRGRRGRDAAFVASATGTDRESASGVRFPIRRRPRGRAGVVRSHDRRGTRAHRKARGMRPAGSADRGRARRHQRALSSCGARPASARQPCSTTSSGTRPAVASCGRPASSRRWSCRSPGFISSARRSSTGSSGCRVRSATRSRTAFGLRSGPRRTGSSSGSPCSTLLADVAEAQPLICLVDDGQWLDRASAQVLGFVARRLGGGVGRDAFRPARTRRRSRLRGSAGAHRRATGGARRAGAPRLGGPGRLDEPVRERILAEAAATRSRCSSCREVGHRPHSPAVSACRTAFRFPPRSRRASGGASRPLPHDTRRLLLVAAAEPVGDPALVLAAAAQLGISAGGGRACGDVGPARGQAAGSVPSSPRPLGGVPGGVGAERRLRPRGACPGDGPVHDPDRRAWHLAAAAAGPDEEVALELERSAGRAQARGGVAAAAAFLQRAVELTPDPSRRARARRWPRREATFLAGAFDDGASGCWRPRRPTRSTGSSAPELHCSAGTSPSSSGTGTMRRRCSWRRPGSSSRSTSILLAAHI